MRTTRNRTMPARTRRAAAALLSGLLTLALLAPGMQSPAEEAQAGGQRGGAKDEQEARRKESARRLELIGKALHAFHDTYKGFPPAAICDRKTGKPLLSWRVAILPFIEQKNLHKLFKLDEPWDGPNNKKLMEIIVPLYAPPGAKPEEAFKTFYRGFVAAPGSPVTAWQTVRAPGSPLGAQGPRVTGIRDGTANTLAVVEAGEAVPWTKPDELVHDFKKPLPRLGGLFKTGFNALMLDGSVLFISNRIDEASLRALITAANGDVVDLAALRKKGLVK